MALNGIFIIAYLNSKDKICTLYSEARRAMPGVASEQKIIIIILCIYVFILHIKNSSLKIEWQQFCSTLLSIFPDTSNGFVRIVLVFFFKCLIHPILVLVFLTWFLVRQLLWTRPEISHSILFLPREWPGCFFFSIVCSLLSSFCGSLIDWHLTSSRSSLLCL